MDDTRDVVNAIHNACEWGSFETADTFLEKYTKKKVCLAKIEVLEEMEEELSKTLFGRDITEYLSGRYDGTVSIISRIDDRIKNLKAGN